MVYIGRRIYFDVQTGDILVNTGERVGNDITPFTVEYESTIYTKLKDRDRETFDFIELEYGQYAEDFATCSGYKVDVETKTLVFSYGGSEETPPVYTKPLTEQVKILESQLATQDLAIANQEQAIAELTMIVAMGQI